MSFARARAVRGLQSGLRQSSARPALKTNAFRRAQIQAKRFASSGGHGEAKSSSDLPWLLGALIITPPSCYYLWPSPHAEHHDDHGDHSKHEEHEESEGAEPEAESKGEEAAASDDKEEEEPAKEEGDSEEKSGDDESSKSTTADNADEHKSEPEEKKGGSDVEGVNFKGKVKEDSDANKNIAKSEPDKGIGKKRLDSGNQKNLGPALEDENGQRDHMSEKQKGISNTQTRHSIPIHEDPEKSKKADGTPETAKTVGTVNKR